MITVQYAGEFPGNTSLGNKLIQASFGRILAEKSGRALRCQPLRGFPNIHDRVGKVVSGEPFFVDGHVVDYDSLPQDRPWFLRGYFQRYEYYRDYKWMLKTDWLKQQIRVDRSHPQDHVIHYRLGDYLQHNAVIPISFFVENLRGNKDWFNLSIVTDSPKHTLLKELKCAVSGFVKGQITVHSTNDEFADFQHIQKFGHIHMSQSTFSWCAAFLSKATRIYFPLPKFGYWSDQRPEIDLRVDDEERYIFREVE